METTWKRPKVIPSKTEHIETECGTMHLTFGYEDDILIEVRASIGKNGVCPNVMLDTIAKFASMLLQSGLARYKIIQKLKKQFVGLKCTQGKPCIETIAEKIIQEIEKQIG